MENLDLFNIVLFVVTGFVAAFIDSTVGGGGLISVPALLTSGLPVSMVLGTNKLAASMGAVTSVISFWRSGNIIKNWLYPGANVNDRFRLRRLYGAFAAAGFYAQPGCSYASADCSLYLQAQRMGQFSKPSRF